MAGSSMARAWGKVYTTAQNRKESMLRIVMHRRVRFFHNQLDSGPILF